MTRLYRSIGIAFAATVALSMTVGCPSETAEPDPWPGNMVLEAATPAVVATTPPADAAGVAADTAVSVTFSRDIARDSLVNPQTNTPTGTLALKDSTGTELAGSITYNPATFTATFWPREALATDRLYTAIIRDVQDAAGAALPTPYFWSFTTASVTESARLSVASAEPAPGGTNVMRNAAIRVTFNRPLDPASVVNLETNASTGALLVKTPAGANVAGTVTYNPSTASVLFVPTAFLGANLTHVASIKDVRTIDGVTLAEPYTWSFTTGIEPGTPPQVVSTMPASGAIGVARDTSIQVTFSEPINGLSASTFVVRDLVTNAVLTARSLVVNNGDLTATFRSQNNLSPRTTYSVTVQDLTGVSGFPMPQHIWSFTTGDLPDTTPIVLSMSPAGGATGVPRNARISVLFGSAITGIGTTTFVLRNTLTNALITAETVTFSNATFTAQFLPNAFLLANTRYTATLRNLTGADGVPLPETSWEFTTGSGPDNVAPTVTAGGLTARAACADEIMLEWSPASDDVTPQPGIAYQVFFSLGSGGYDLNMPAYVTAPGAMTFRLTGLTRGETYFVTVRAVDGSGNRSAGFTERSALLPTLLRCPTSIAVPSGPSALTSADFNADGRADLAIACSNASSVAVLVGNGAGAFLGPTTWAVGSQPVDLAAADFTNDGFLDLVVANRGGGTISVLPGNGDGTFDLAVTTVVAGAQAVAAGEFDNPPNGNRDLAIATGDDITVLSGNGNGTFSGVVTRLTVATTADARDVATGDFDNDGRSDIAVCYAGTDNAAAWLNSTPAAGAHTFTAPTTATNRLFTVQNGPSAIVAADLNADGIPDVAVTNTGTPSVTVRQSSAQAANLFPAGENTALPAGANPIALATGDIDGDGLTDLVTANRTSGTVSVLTNLAATSLFAVESADGGLRPIGAAVADCNGDGKLDAAFADFTGNAVSVLLNAR